jgi:hypothetical protein
MKLRKPLSGMSIVFTALICLWAVPCLAQNSREFESYNNAVERERRFRESPNGNHGCDFILYPAETMRFGVGLSEDLAKIKLEGKVGYVDVTGKTVIAPRFEEGGAFSEDLARVRLDGKWGFIDRTGQWVIKPTYEWVGPFRYERALVRINERWGLYR